MGLEEGQTFALRRAGERREDQLGGAHHGDESAAGRQTAACCRDRSRIPGSEGSTAHRVIQALRHVGKLGQPDPRLGEGVPRSIQKLALNLLGVPDPDGVLLVLGNSAMQALRRALQSGCNRRRRALDLLRSKLDGCCDLLEHLLLRDAW
eukprot:9230346-Pyramimonas_sp.AAC.1